MGRKGDKVHFLVCDIFTNEKYETIERCNANIDAPFITTQHYTVLDIDSEGQLSLMDEENNTIREDLNLPTPNKYTTTNDSVEAVDQLLSLERVCKAVKAGVELKVTVVSAMGTDQVLAYKGN